MMISINPAEFMHPQEVYELIQNAVTKKYPFAMIRIGDGEALALAQEVVLPIAEIKKQQFLTYAGISVPNLRARNELLQSLLKADLVGLPNRFDLPYFSPLVNKVLAHYQINLPRTCDCCINYHLHQKGLLLPLFASKRVLVVGRRSPDLTPVLQNIYKLNVVGQIRVNNYRQIPVVMQEINKQRFDIAFVAAGIPAVTICVKIAAELGKVALDLGHLADRMIEEYL